jgi:3-oxoacyl-[acyl-carrier protein] reductase
VVAADVGDFARAPEVVDEVRSALGGLHILVANAGINRDRVVWKMEEEDWDAVLTVNLKGAFNYARAVAPLFREQGGGRIVGITSINGLRGKFGQTNYAASKAGLIGLVKSLARELGRAGVTVNAVAPGIVRTEMVAGMPEEAIRASVAETVLGRIGSPEDVANLVVFLASDLAGHVTGEVVRVDGGQYI